MENIEIVDIENDKGRQRENLGNQSVLFNRVINYDILELIQLY